MKFIASLSELENIPEKKLVDLCGYVIRVGKNEKVDTRSGGT